MTILERDKQPTLEQPASGLEVLSWPPEDLLEFRRQFVLKMGWFEEPHPSDWDRYDDPAAATLHFANRGDTGEVLSGMRLTKIASPTESLSIDMLGTNAEMQQKALLFGQTLDFTHTDVWDLTRLVHHLEDEPRHLESVIGILPMFGAGLAKTAPQNERDLAWLFTTTASMHRHLKGAGIIAQEIAQGKINATDESDSYFCIIHPVQAMQYLKEHRDSYGFTHDHVYEGFQAVK